MKRIVVVDDALFSRFILKRYLTELGYEVVGEATNGEEAFSMYKQVNPDLMFMDVIMPQVDGIKGLKMIKNYDQEAKVVMLTSYNRDNVFEDLYAFGADEILLKPITMDLLTNVLIKMDKTK